MNRVKIMINGMPGNMAVRVATMAAEDKRFEILPYSLTGPEINDLECRVSNMNVSLISPKKKDDEIKKIKAINPEFISIDYTHPLAVLENAEFYCKNMMPFVMGTTGSDRDKLEKMVSSYDLYSVIAPNMAKQIVGFQAMMEWAADTFPGLFDGYSLTIEESHQQGKADTSGTAKAMAGYFNDLGLTQFSQSDIIQERNPEVQQQKWQIPTEFLNGHAWHTYSLVSDDNTVKFRFDHNVNGRDVYVRGTLDAVNYLAEKIRTGADARIYTMIDVLKQV
ncbi:dihydrodipicolinate reductase [Desulfobacterales bacterium HSG16]|nr:dihydrodipicolinate reductase [Desulfobacterales bacterium HSG16]